jgi:hypothetical protein
MRLFGALATLGAFTVTAIGSALGAGLLGLPLALWTHHIEYVTHSMLWGALFGPVSLALWLVWDWARR